MQGGGYRRFTRQRSPKQRLKHSQRGCVTFHTSAFWVSELLSLPARANISPQNSECVHQQNCRLPAIDKWLVITAKLNCYWCIFVEKQNKCQLSDEKWQIRLKHSLKWQTVFPLSFEYLNILTSAADLWCTIYWPANSFYLILGRWISAFSNLSWLFCILLALRKSRSAAMWISKAIKTHDLIASCH